MTPAVRRIKDVLKRPQIIFFMFAIVLLFGGFCNLHKIIFEKDYVETKGIVCNLESEQVKKKHSSQTCYNYDIVWHDDGKEYVKHFKKQKNPMKEGEITIWVHPDNLEAELSHSTNIGKDAVLPLAIGLLCGALGFFIRYLKIKKEDSGARLKRLENAKLESIVWIIGILILMAVYGVMCYQDYRQGEYLSPLTWDGLIGMGILEIISIVVFFRTKKLLKTC